MNKIRFAVIGAGVMGGHHLKNLATLPDVEISFVVDPLLSKAQKLATLYGGRATSQVSDMIGSVDAAVIATPSITHHEVAFYLLEKGIHCLVEKPLGLNKEHCKALVQAARQKGVLLGVGHIEQFNPAIQKLKSILDPTTIYSIEARRLNFGSARIQDADVIEDLMIHDLDIVLSLLPYKIGSIVTHSLSLNKREADYAHTAMRFQNPSQPHRPILVHVTASRMTQAKVRELHVTTSQGYFTVHYASQELFVSRMPYRSSKEGTYHPELSLDRIKVKQDNALGLELTNFVQAIQGREKLLISGERALKTLDLVWKIQHQVYAKVQERVAF